MQAPSCSPAESIAALKPGVPASALVAVLLGIEPAKEVDTKMGDRTFRCVLSVADASRPTGVELTVWGPNALRLAYLRPLQIIHIPSVTLRIRTWNNFRNETHTIESIHTEAPHKIRYLVEETECSCAKSEVARELAVWNHAKHGELANVVLSARTTSVVPKKRKRNENNNINSRHMERKGGEEEAYAADENGQVKPDNSNAAPIRWIRGVIKSLCIRGNSNTDGGGNEDVNVGKMLQDAVVKLCRTCKEKVTGSKCTKCMPLSEGGSTSYTYAVDEEAVALRLGIDGVIARCAGDDLARLLFIDAKELMEDAENRARKRAEGVLRALASDRSELEIAVQNVGSEVRLRTLRF